MAIFGDAFTFTGFFTEFAGIAAIVITIHLLFVSLMYMASKILSNENLLGFSRHEFSQAIYSAIILGTVLFGIVIVNNMFCLSIPQGLYAGACQQDENFGFSAHLKVARAHLSESYNNLRVLAKGTLRAFDWAASGAGLSTNVGLFKAMPLHYMSVHSYIFGESFSILYKALLFIKIQELFLIINAAYFFPFLFNVGLVFRAVPFTRKLGGLLMGITLGLYFALPYMYILSQIVLESSQHFSTRFILETAKYQFAFFSFGDIMGSDGNKMDFDDYVMEQRRKELEEKEWSDISGNPYGAAVAKRVSEFNGQEALEASTGRSIVMPEPGANKAFGGSNDYYDPHDPDVRSYSLVEIVARVVLAATFTSVFALAGTLSAIREISQLFGGDVEIAGLTRLI